MAEERPRIAVLGAGGLIGHELASGLREKGWRVVPVARRFTPFQRAEFSEDGVEAPVVDWSGAELADLFNSRSVDVLVNCIGVLQDGLGAKTGEVHERFVSRLIDALRINARPRLLVHVSIPGRAKDDRTEFSRSKRAAESLIASSGLPFVILRPGFVVAADAYGGGALIRALAAAPFALPRSLTERPFATAAITDLIETLAWIAERWTGGGPSFAATWDVMDPHPRTVGDVISAFRSRCGGKEPRVVLPEWLMRLGARAGDAAAVLGWTPPIRSTALVEMARGVEGDPGSWMVATRIKPRPLAEALAAIPATVQEVWFAHLFLLKPLVLGVLVLFWVVSGALALTVSAEGAKAILVLAGLGAGAAGVVAPVAALADIAVGVGIAVRSTSRAALVAGIVLSLLYLAAGTVLGPGLWLDPLGAFVKTVPIIALMLVALAIGRPRGG